MSSVLSVIDFIRIEEIRAQNVLARRMQLESNVFQRWEYYRDDLVARREVSGDQRMKALHKRLAELDVYFPRSQQQREFHDAFIQACLPLIYGKDLNRHLVRILRSLNANKLQCEVMICTPRRFGKTMGTVLYVVAVLLALGLEVVVYSIGGRTSNMFSAQVYNVMVQLLGGDHRIITYNKETLVVISDHGTKAVLHAYPSKSTIRHFPPPPKEPPLLLSFFFSPSFRVLFCGLLRYTCVYAHQLSRTTDHDTPVRRHYCRRPNFFGNHGGMVGRTAARRRL